MTKEQILKIVDRCFHMYASDFRNEAKKDAEKMIDEQLRLDGVVGQSEQLPERLCKNNPNFVCNCIEQDRCPNFPPY